MNEFDKKGLFLKVFKSILGCLMHDHDDHLLTKTSANLFPKFCRNREATSLWMNEFGMPENTKCDRFISNQDLIMKR